MYLQVFAEECLYNSRQLMRRLEMQHMPGPGNFDGFCVQPDTGLPLAGAECKLAGAT
jgi:hypothetical protein